MSNRSARFACTAVLLASAAATGCATPGAVQPSNDGGRGGAGSSSTSSSPSSGGDGGTAGAGGDTGTAGSGGAPTGDAVQVWISDGDLKLHEAAVGHALTLQTAVQHKYVSAENGGGGALRADRDQAQAWETFTLVDLNGGDLQSGDLVAIRTASGNWISAQNAGGGSVSAGAAKPADWETFVVERVAGGTGIQSGDQIAFRTRDGAHFLSAVNGGGGDVVASATSVAGWEAFVATIGPATTRWMERQMDVAFAGGAPDGAIVVDDAAVGQTMQGFGSSFTEASAWLFRKKLSDARRAEAIASLFGTADGIGLRAMRLPMGASDMMSDPGKVYSYDDVPAGQSDPALAHFSIDPDRQDVVPLIQEVTAIAPDLFLMASPWSPPAWMKTSGSLVGGGLRGDGDVRAAYAQYFVRFLQAYAKEGIAIQAVTPQNEPLYQPAGYPGCGIDAGTEAAFVGGYLGSAIAGAGLGTRILAYDHNWDHPEYALSVLDDAAAGPHVAGSAFHCYGGSPEAQDQVHAAHPDKEIWMTECSDGDWESDPFGSKMWLLVESTRHWAVGAILWNLAMTLDGGPALPGGCTSCRGVIAIDPATGTWLREVQYPALGHFSRFVRPGAVRLGSDGGPDGLQHVAFRNTDGTHVLVVHNQAGDARAFDVVTGSRSFAYTLAAGAAATFRW